MLKSSFFAAAALALSAPAFAQSRGLVKKCVAHVQAPSMPGTYVLTVSIVQSKNGLVAYSTQSGDPSPIVDPAQFDSFAVRPGLTAKSNGLPGLNRAEGLVAHAMSLAGMGPGFGDVGFDLRQVRFANVYSFGKQGGSAPVGMTAIVDAFDANRRPLGSFLGGFVATRCR